MITLANTVREQLEKACATVWYFYPQSWMRMPMISWRESGNREIAQADGREHLAELEYTVDVWSDSAAENLQLAEQVDARMTALRLRREHSADVYDRKTGAHHRAMRYRCVADADGNIYQ